MSPVDVADVIMMNSPGEIRRQLSASYNALLQQQQQSQQAQQAQQEQAIQLETEHLKQDALDKQLDRENKLNIARIEAGVDIINSQSSTTVAPDTTAKDEDLRRTAEQNVNLKRDKLELDKQKLNLDNNNKQEKLANDRAKIAADLQIQHEQTQTARIMKGKKLP
jgi:hypothetical protein